MLCRDHGMGTQALHALQHRGVRRHMKRAPAGQADATDVTASEIACYAYCAKAWHLEHVQHVVVPDETSRRREHGVAAHEAHGASVHALGQGRKWTRVIAAVLLLIAALAAVSTLLLR